MWDAGLGAGLSALPALRTLVFFHSLGARRVVNVSGVQSRDLYGIDLPSTLDFHDFRFPDVFTRNQDPVHAWETLGEAGRDALIEAVRCASEALANAIPVLVFCHLGVGRSPLVLAMALECALGMDRERAVATVRSIRTEASFSPAALGVWERIAAGTTA